MVRKRRRYALHMKDGLPTIEGLVVRRDREGFELLDAELLRSADDTEQLAGPLIVLRANVFCLQEIK